MTNLDDIMKDFTKQIHRNGIIEIHQIPNIDLYMDQVTTFMDKALSVYKRFDSDKILTKTMINNYTKAKIFPAPIKKKYSKTHIMLLIMIYHLKSILSIRDIGILFRPILEFKSQEEISSAVLELYTGFIHLQKVTQKTFISSTELQKTSLKEVIDSFEDNDLKKILMVLLLTIRANIEKQLAERALDFYF
ncbi:DUF1836 domain-containing protein [Chakrabartyella piscis]|uniref:DUF1836 domain-containing protein n=1 Tax=Chakrabartyella piscis TaxID=2918914 RepID=UPI002958B005|nr:DUF1836 domain-containing protein [Chakrabartyella piscis]